MQTLGLSMIVKNEAKVLPSCLDSVRGLVSQIVVGDTGSTDGTPNIAQAYGAHVISVPWEDHFANARNAVLKHLTTDWILALDADEELDSNAVNLMHSLLEAADTSAYTISLRCYVRVGTSYCLEVVSHPNDYKSERATQAGSYHELKTIRLIRRDPRVYYCGRVHELLEYRLCQLGLSFPECGLIVHNFGYLKEQTEESVRAKDAYYRRLSRLKIEEQPDNPFAWFDLGKLEYETFCNLEFALSCFQQAAQLCPPFVRAWLFAAEINLRLGQLKEALTALTHTESTQEAACWRERLRGDICFQSGQLRPARKAYLYAKALQLSGTDPQLESRLGYTEVLLGLRDAGIQKLQNAVNLMPSRPELHDLLMKAHIISGDLPGAAMAAERLAAEYAHPKAFLRAAAIRAQLKQFEAAETLVAQGLEIYPNSVELRDSFAHLRQQAISAARS